MGRDVEVGTAMAATSVREIERATPADRDRYVDAIRLGAIVLVVLGHWLVGVVWVEDGTIEVDRLLARFPETRPLTWLFQVMPLFFLVGGAVNAGSWQRAHDRGEPWTLWVRRRARRLVGPMTVLLAVWVPVTAVLRFTPVPEPWVGEALDHALLPLWFVVVYLAVTVATPLTLAWHVRAGLWVLAGAVAATAAVDIAQRAGDLPVGAVNYLLVWAGAHQVGYLWRDGRLPDGARDGLVLALGSLAALLTLVGVAGYPVSMVAPGAGVGDNADPPTLALWALLGVQLGVIRAVRGPVTRRLHGRLWATVVRGGSVVMTVFLWHMTALILVAVLAFPTGLVPGDGTVDATWWWTRPLWVAGAVAVLAGLTATFARFERSAPPTTPVGRLRAVVGVAATAGGLAVALAGGVHEPGEPLGLPLAALAAYALGVAALGAAPRPPS